ncbi:MAG: phosphate ABC transporter permease subunit PstC [Firmicutes bacterium]|nr:phosphate ABC transporter permease subunit PstC [Bacillota bacterium]
MFLSIFFLFSKNNKNAFIFSLFTVASPLSVIFIDKFIQNSKILNFEIFFINLLILFIIIFLLLNVVNIDRAWRSIFGLIALICLAVVFSIIIYLLFLGLPAIFKIGFFKFLFGKKWSPSENLFGIFPFITCSLVVTLGAIFLGVPVGVLSAVFLSEFAPKKIALFVRLAIKLLASIPSVIYGFFGMLVVVPLVKKISPKNTTGDCLLTAILILAIMILPTIISICESAIRSVPTQFKEAALALGESKAKSIFKVVIPIAKRGIISSIFLGVGKALGETMALIMVAGNAINFPHLLKSARFLTTGLALEISYASGFHRSALFAIGLVLFFLIFLINFIFIRIFKQKD